MILHELLVNLIHLTYLKMVGVGYIYLLLLILKRQQFTDHKVRDPYYLNQMCEVFPR